MSSEHRPVTSRMNGPAARAVAAAFGILLVMGLGASWWSARNPRLHGHYEWFLCPGRSVTAWALGGAACLAVIALSWAFARRYARWTGHDIARLLAGYVLGPAVITLAIVAVWPVAGMEVDWRMVVESTWPTVLIMWGAGYLLAWARLSAQVTLPLMAACWVAGFGLEWIILRNVIE